MTAVHGVLAPLWATAGAVALHALVHAGHLAENMLLRRELRRRRLQRAALAVPQPTTRQESTK